MGEEGARFARGVVIAAAALIAVSMAAASSADTATPAATEGQTRTPEAGAAARRAGVERAMTLVRARPRTMRVTATAFTLTGRTATGMRTRRGVVAVDPAVIPLGTRMAIPGYGEGVAADTGRNVRGAQIDVWLPTRAQALAWGTRVVTVTLR